MRDSESTGALRTSCFAAQAVSTANQAATISCSMLVRSCVAR